MRRRRCPISFDVSPIRVLDSAPDTDSTHARARIAEAVSSAAREVDTLKGLAVARVASEVDGITSEVQAPENVSFSAFAKQFARYRAPAFGQAVLLETALRWGVVAPGYGCFYHRTRGAKACENGLTAPMDEINVTVLEGFRRDVFTPDLRTGTIEDLIREWQTQAVDAIPRREDLERELRALEAEIAGLEEQLATGAPWPLIQDPLEARRRRREALVVPVAGWARASVPTSDLELERRRQDALPRLTDP